MKWFAFVIIILLCASCKTKKHILNSDSISVSTVQCSSTMANVKDSTSWWRTLNADFTDFQMVYIPKEIVSSQDSTHLSISCLDSLASDIPDLHSGMFVIKADKASFRDEATHKAASSKSILKKDSVKNDSASVKKENKDISKPQSFIPLWIFIILLVSGWLLIEYIARRFF